MYAISAVILAVSVIMFFPVRAEINFKGKKVSLTAYITGIRVFSRVLSKKDEIKEASNDSPLKRTAEIEKVAVSFWEKIEHCRQIYKNAVKLLRKYVEISIVNLKIELGTEDAAVTAVSVGALWSAVYGLIGALGNVVYIKKHNVQINPVYTKSVFYLDGNCIIRSRLVYIIIIAITILIKLHSRKGKEE